MKNKNLENSGFENESDVPVWASWLGIITIVLGVYLTAAHGNELMKHWVLDGPAAITIPGHEPKCPEDELEEEGITLDMCLQATASNDTLLLTRPDWFRGFQIGLMSVGTIAAFISIFVGVALIEFRPWAPLAALATFATLAAVDALGFIAVINTGPLIRQMYLWNILLWFFIHAIMFVAAIAGKHESENQGF